MSSSGTRTPTSASTGGGSRRPPVFDQALCERVGLKALEFDGRHDSLFHPFDREGRRHMEYLCDRGTFLDVPFEMIQADFRLAYPSLVDERGLKGDFRTEAITAH
jgi:hypothetical protein